MFAEEIRKTILKLADERGPEKTFALSDVAREMNVQDSHQLADQVNFVAEVLINEGKIISKNSSDNKHSELSKAPALIRK